MRALRPVVALSVALLVSTARAGTFEARPGAGDRIVVHAYKKGAFAAFAHDHHFEVTKWHATADLPDGEPAQASVDVVLSAGSLRDGQERLSQSDRRKVEAQTAGPDVLDAQHHPEIEFRSERFEADRGGTPGHVRGTLHGTLTLRGRAAPADVAIEADRDGNAWRVRGKARVKQTAFGIKPYSGFGGTVGVKDDLEIEIALTLRARGG